VKFDHSRDDPFAGGLIETLRSKIAVPEHVKFRATQVSDQSRSDLPARRAQWPVFAHSCHCGSLSDNENSLPATAVMPFYPSNTRTKNAEQWIAGISARKGAIQ
jgi:hypothetical protein